MAAAANATTTRISAHLGRRKLMLGLMESLHESAMLGLMESLHKSALSLRFLPQNHNRIRGSQPKEIAGLPALTNLGHGGRCQRLSDKMG
jgi:hypothetical protein